MSFEVEADAYDRFMGRYSSLLAGPFAGLADIRLGQRVLDVGCGPGALTGELVVRLGAASVSAVDPSESFVGAARLRYPGVDVEQAPAERLPFEDGAFDTTLAQLVVHFMSDPAAGIAEMRRVTRSGGIVAACVWDFGGRRAPLSPFWAAARELDPGVEDESRRAGAQEGSLARLFEGAGLRDVEASVLSVAVEHPSFEEWWHPYTLGVGPAGAFVAGLGDDRRADLRERCLALLPEPPFVLTSCAWASRGVVP